MIKSMIDSYFTILSSIGVCVLSLIIVGVYLIIRNHLLVSSEAIANNAQSINNTEELPTTKHTASIEALVELTKPQIIQADRQSFESQDYSNMSEIAGDDIAATQLDLAKALIETGKIDAAKNILQVVANQGSQSYQLEARKLLKSV